MKGYAIRGSAAEQTGRVGLVDGAARRWPARLKPKGKNMEKLQEKAGPEPSDTELSPFYPLDYNAKDPNYMEDDDGLGAFRGLISAVAIVTAGGLFALSWIREGFAPALAGFGCACFATVLWRARKEAEGRVEAILVRMMACFLVLLALNMWGVW